MSDFFDSFLFGCFILLPSLFLFFTIVVILLLPLFTLFFLLIFIFTAVFGIVTPSRRISRPVLLRSEHSERPLVSYGRIRSHLCHFQRTTLYRMELQVPYPPGTIPLAVHITCHYCNSTYRCPNNFLLATRLRIRDTNSCPKFEKAALLILDLVMTIFLFVFVPALIAQVLVLLRSQPASAFTAVDWTKYVPHLFSS